MFKQASSQATTKQLRKTKLLDSFRQNTVTRTKVMLTDLCPEQKAKIGDLVRTLQTRKSQSLILEQKLKEMQKRQIKYLQKIEQLQKLVKQNHVKQLKFKQQLTLSKVKQQQRQRYIEHLLNQKQDNVKQLSKRKIVPCVDQFALTQPIITTNQYIQVNQKRKKYKQRTTQTQTEYINSQFRKYPNNSKSFEKIMRGRTNSVSNSVDRNKKSKGNKQKIRSQIVIDDEENYQEFGNYQKSKHEQEQVIEDEDDDFNLLAQKWLELKQKNMSKIKQSYKKSKEKAQNTSNQRSAKKLTKNIQIPRQFSQKNIAQQQQQGSNYEQKINIENNQSFGPQKNKKRGVTSKIQIDEDFDEIQLNKILKSKNFSASRLLNKNRENSQQSQRQFRYQNNMEQKRSKRHGAILDSQNTPNMKMSNISNSRSHHNIDFYETDLLDIVSSINKK